MKVRLSYLPHRLYMYVPCIIVCLTGCTFPVSLSASQVVRSLYHCLPHRLYVPCIIVCHTGCTFPVSLSASQVVRSLYHCLPHRLYVPCIIVCLTGCTFPVLLSASQVVRSLLVSLAHHETYHAMFNQFVRENPLVLEEREFGFLKHCMGLLDFRNKLNWIKRKLNSLR